MRRALLLFAACVTVALTLASGRATADAAPADKEPPKPPPWNLDSGDTAWMLVSTGLVLLMVPGLALFYGGMVRRKNVLGTMMHSMVALALIGVQWVLFGYALAFGDIAGRLDRLDADSPGPEWGDAATSSSPGPTSPSIVHCMYQGMFAIITPALICGAIAERIRFGPYCLFILLWVHAGLRPAGALGLGGRL